MSDLDELVLQCRDRKARAYLSESVRSYKAGAFRASIVATWVAICFDYMDKLRELAISGDKNASADVEELKKMHNSNDLKKSLEFERELLDRAKSYELISDIEYIDLKRIQEDRNRCAHPSLVGEEDVYLPSAELARQHIHAAVIHFLRHPPAQGRYALERLVKDVESDYFPMDEKQAMAWLQSGPLAKPRESLVRNYVVILLKKLIIEKQDGNARARSCAALLAISHMHIEQYHQAIASKAAELARTIEDENLIFLVQLLKRVPALWESFEADIHERIAGFVREWPSKIFWYFGDVFSFEPLQHAMVYRAKRATSDELISLQFFYSAIPIAFVERLIDLYAASKSYAEANRIGECLESYLKDIEKHHIEKIIVSAGKNLQIAGSIKIYELVKALNLKKIMPQQEFEGLLAANGLADCLERSGEMGVEPAVKTSANPDA